MAGDAAAAETTLRDAMSYAVRQQTRSFELRAAIALAKLLHSTGRPEEARDVLSPVYQWFTEGQATADLKAAQALLSEIG